MDCDIDIEEHDVLDNPRIKSIFPDLSAVKIEPQLEEDIEEEGYVEEQYGVCNNNMPYDAPTEEPQQMPYEYEYSFETAPDDVPEEMEVEYEGEDSSYYYDNEIILGSKPSPDIELLYEEAYTSHPIVVLENWEERLQTSPCYCDTCEILFPTVNALDAHKMISHSYLVAMETPHKNTARKSTAPSKYCNHCSKTFPDDTSLIKHLYELLPLNNFPKVKEEKIEPEKPKFRTTGPWPQKVKSTSRVISKIRAKKIKIEPRDVKIEPELVKDIKPKLKLQRDGKIFAASSLVPKSTLFQCNVCQVGFLSCFSAVQHAKMCRKVLTFNKCGICKRKIRIRDTKTHELQHTYNDKLKIYTMNKTIYEKVLCKCPKCQSCFDELGFWAHYQNCKKSDKKSMYCSDCDVNISQSRYKWHRQKHLTKKLTKKDFIIIEFYDQNNIKIDESRVEVMKQHRRERQRLYNHNRKYNQKKLSLNESKNIDKSIKVYYCELCGCCQCRLNYKGHTDGLCKRTLVKKYCEKCGLCFTSKSIESHQNLHERRSFSLKDICVISLTTGKPMDLPMADFYECHTCLKNFLSRRSLHFHNCKTEKYITCKICTKKYNIAAYKIHKIFHSVDKLMPQLMMKYNLINNMWNVVFMCVSCELVTMTYDSAVTHSQGHLNYIISDFHKQCVVCDLKIAEKDFSVHEKLHANNESITRESFKILKYNYETLFRKEWLMLLFQELPKEHREQILSKSIYRYTRSVKMQVEISAPTADTKYFCMNCNIFVEGPFVKRHIKSNCSRNNKLVCNVCHEVFKSLKPFLAHEVSHRNVTKRQTVVTFNNECDREFNNHLSLIESNDKKTTKEVPLSILREILLSDNVKATYKLYKCVKCETCLTLKSSIGRHRCVADGKRRFCEICQQYFCYKKTTMHAEAHKKKPYITKDSFFIVYFNGGTKTAKNAAKKALTAKLTPKMSPKKEVAPKISPKKIVVAKIFQCECGLHFTSMKTIEKHLDQCSPKLKVSGETCSKCNLVFPTEVLVTHLVNHHHKETKIVIEKIAKANLLKCPKCYVHFTNMENFDLHTSNCDARNNTQCNNCGLKFGKKCFLKHLCSTSDVTYMNKVTVVRKKIIKEAVVYRCAPCDVTYLQRNSYKYHAYEVNHVLKKPPIPCDICGLKFTNCSFRKHKNIHSFPNEEYKIKVVERESGQFEILTGTNRGKDDGNTGRRKRKFDDQEENEASVKKVRTNLNDLDTLLSERRRSRKTMDKASTSKDSQMDLDDTPSEIIVPDEISFHTNLTENISNVSEIDIDNSVTLPEKIDDTLDTSGLSFKLKSRILVKGYGKVLYKCLYCNLHYMKKESLVYHVSRNPGHHDVSDSYKCDICEIEFSKHTLPRHKYVHHDKMGLKRDDFVILTESPLSKPSESSQEAKVENDSEILDVSTDIHNETKIENDSLNNTKVLGELNVGDDGDTEILSVINISDTCDTKSEIIENISDVSDPKSEIIENISDTSDPKSKIIENITDTSDPKCEIIENISDTSDLKSEIIEIINTSDTEILSDENISETCDTKSEIIDILSDTEKICYFKCSECNVCFVEQKMCFEHTSNHHILDPKTYIQCKICDFQFLIDSLKEHVILHHNSDFNIERLTIHEYKAVGVGLNPKIDIYQAVNKVQSRLVSTTTDVGIV